MAVARSIRLVVLSLSLVLLGFFLLSCGSQESPKEATKEKALPVALPPAAPPEGATTLKTTKYINQGKEFLGAKQYDQAIVSFSEAIKLDPQSVQAYNNRGVASCNKGDFERAIDDFSRTIEINPKFGKGYNNRAVAYFMKGERDKARQDAEKAQSLGIPVNQTFLDILKKSKAKAEETGKGGAPKSSGPAPGKPEAQGKSETQGN